MTIGRNGEGRTLKLDVDKLVGGHSCVLGNTGSGKSHTVRKLLEEVKDTFVQVIFDPEGEFHTLRQTAPYVLVGGEFADLPLGDPAALARWVRTTKQSVVVQLNEMETEGQGAFIGRFLDALMALPKSLWGPTLLVIDEAHRYAPQAGAGSNSLKPITELLARGRKRGFSAMLATQRLAKIHKNAIAEVSNWFIGRTSPNDRRRSGDVLGFPGRSDEEMALSSLRPGSFWCFGPAVCLSPTLIRVDPTASAHLTLGQTWAPAPLPDAARNAIPRSLSGFGGRSGSSEPGARGAGPGPVLAVWLFILSVIGGASWLSWTILSHSVLWRLFS